MVLEKLKQYSIYLCSQSPRRQELLRKLDIDFMVASKISIDETYPQDLTPGEVPIYLAKKKISAYENILKKNRLLLTADTLVIVNNQILGKPQNLDEAKKMLEFLSNKMHLVITGMCIKDINKTQCFSDTTKVWFKKLSEQEINYYVEKYKPLDKAGAYGIQEWIGFIGIEKIEGSYNNVVGLPIEKLYSELKIFFETN